MYSASKPKKSTAQSVKKSHGTSPVAASQQPTSSTSRQPLGAFYSCGPVVGTALQAKFTIGRAGDPFEREADSAADALASGRPAPTITPVPTGGLNTLAKAEENPGNAAVEEKEEPESNGVENAVMQTELEEPEFGESGAQPKLFQMQEIEQQADTKNEEENTNSATTLQAQEESDTDTEEEQEAVVQRKCAECEKEESAEQMPQAKLIQREEEPTAGSSEKEEPVQTRLLQLKVEIPTLPEAQPQQNTAANQQDQKDDAEKMQEAIGEEALADAGESASEEEGGADPTLESYEPVEKEPPPPVQAKRESVSSDGLEHNLQSAQSSGQPLDKPIRSEMEHHFQRDLSGVRIHTDGSSAQMNKGLGARAFTQGNHIYFNAGQYEPDSASGKHLLTHELTHTIQQGAVGNTVQKFEAPEQTVSTDPAAEVPNDGGEVTGRMNQKIEEETEDQDPEDMSEEEREAAENPDRGEVRRDSSSLHGSGQSSPSVDRGAIAQEKTTAQKQQIEQQVSEPSEEAPEESSDASEEDAQLSDAEAAAQRAEEAESRAQSVQIPAHPEPFRHPRMDAPVDSAGEALPRQSAMDTRVRGLGYIGEMLRERGYEMKRAAAEQEVGSYGYDVALESLREDLANSVEGTALMKTHNEERKTIIEEARTAHVESVDRQQFVAEKAPDLAAKADEGSSDSGALAADARGKADQAQSEIPSDPDARADGEQQAGEMTDSAQGAESMDQAVTQTGQRARQYQADAAAAADQNQQSDTQIADTDSTVAETDTRLEEMSAANDSSHEQIENAGPGPELIRENSRRTARSGDELIAATIVMELELNALQEEYLANARALESREDAEERIRREQEQQAAAPEQTPEQRRLIELANASPEEQEQIIEEMDQDERDALITEIDSQPTQEEIDAEAEAAAGGDAEADPNADPRAQQIAEIDNRRSERVDGVLNIADRNMTFLTAAQQQMLADRLVAESIGDDIKNINVLQMGRQMIEGMVNPMVSIHGAIDGFRKIGGGIAAAFDADAWAADPLGNLLKVAADISTGLAMVFSSILGIAAIITALMVILTIFSWGTLAWMTGPVIGWMGTVMTYAGWGAIIAGGLSVYFNYLSYIKNLADAGTAETARELFQNTDEMKQNATDGFQGAMAVVEGVGAVKMGPRLSGGEHFSRVPRSPREAFSRAAAGTRRGLRGIAAMPGRIGSGIMDLVHGGRQGLSRLRQRLSAIARRGDAPSTRRADIPDDINVRSPRDGSLGSFDGQRVRAEVDLPGNQRMRILEDGRCVVCASPCRYVGQNYAPELARDPRLAQRLERIERSLARDPNQPRVIQAHREIQLQLMEARVQRPARLRGEFAAELEAHPHLARALDDLEPRIRSKPANRAHQRRIDAVERQLTDIRRRAAEARTGRAQAQAHGYPDNPPPGYEWYRGPDGRPKVRRAQGNPNGPRREFDPNVPERRPDGTPTPLEERFPVRPESASLRQQYLGSTPGKGSATGRSVIDRMRGEGRIETRGTPPRDFVRTRGPPPPDFPEGWHPIEDMDMGHRHDAVTYWNETGRHLGPRHPEVRRWMLDPENYELQHYSFNRSEGSRLGHSGERYLPPTTE